MKKLSDTSQRWIIYITETKKTAFHSVFFFSIQNVKRIPNRPNNLCQFETKFITRRGKRRKEKSQYCCNCSLFKEKDYDPDIFFYIDFNREINENYQNQCKVIIIIHIQTASVLQIRQYLVYIYFFPTLNLNPFRGRLWGYCLVS